MKNNVSLEDFLKDFSMVLDMEEGNYIGGLYRFIDKDQFIIPTSYIFSQEQIDRKRAWNIING